ncbi:hypothetical protein OCA22_26800 [Bacillus cereus]|nr:hypothetical protein [Bacillus cereus]SME50832.1 hypothetical protein BACERE00183_04658 [Bacillus cereus]
MQQTSELLNRILKHPMLEDRKIHSQALHMEMSEGITFSKVSILRDELIVLPWKPYTSEQNHRYGAYIDESEELDEIEAYANIIIQSFTEEESRFEFFIQGWDDYLFLLVIEHKGDEM